MKFGLFGGAKASGQGPAGDSLGYRHYIDYVLLAEQLGLHSAFIVEHHFTGVGQVSASLGVLSYLAARTSRLRLGTAVVVLPWHNPALLAEQIATLDLLSDGRFDLGVGKGYRANEFAGFGMAVDEASERFDETMSFLRRAWSEAGRFSFSSRNWHFHDIVIEPRCLQQPYPPLWMAAGSPDSIRKAASEGYHLLLDQIAPIDLTLQRVALYRAERERSGRPVGPQQVAVARALQIVRTPAEREQALALRLKVLGNIGTLARGPGAERYHEAATRADPTLASEDAALLGTPDEIVTMLRRLQDGGVDYVLLVDPTGSRTALETFATEIMPHFTH